MLKSSHINQSSQNLQVNLKNTFVQKIDIAKKKKKKKKQALFQLKIRLIKVGSDDALKLLRKIRLYRLLKESS